MKYLLNLANFITILGIILAVWANSLAFSGLEKIQLIILLVLGAGLTDLLDGAIARKYHLETQVGAFLDRLRDKILICPFLILVLQKPPTFLEEITFSFLRALVYSMLLAEGILVISGIVGVIKKKNLASNKYGKRKMFFQFLTVSVWVVVVGLREHPENSFLISGLSYLITPLLFLAVIYGFLSLRGYWELYFKKEQHLERSQV